jgi:ATP-dependent Clp protease protease subunit
MIQIIGDIDAAAFAKFDEELTPLEREFGGQRNASAAIILNSDGGDATIGLAFFDRIKASPLSIIITAYGEVNSAATLVFAAGDKRIMTPNSSLYFHEEAVEDISGMSLSEANAHLKRLSEVDQQYNRLIASVSKKGVDFWDYLCVNETYLSPQEALEAGICDEILEY